MPETREFRLSGAGGQGLILAGMILAEAAIREGKNAIQTQSYGPEARGGASKAEVIISDEEIDYPKVKQPDVVVVLSQEASDKYAGQVAKGGLLIVDTTYVQKTPATPARICALPISRTTREALGREMAANVVTLGLLAGLTGAVSREALTAALLARVPKGTETLNLKALELGFELARRETQRATA